ncbi:MAG: M67 family metallopeptidase [Anaerolineales bacterium]|nr:M67 family metallopeptidase [Anaerolineales bacterium]
MLRREQKLLHISRGLFEQIHCHLQRCYPAEGVGFLLGVEEKGHRYVRRIRDVQNEAEQGGGHDRYVVQPETAAHVEDEANSMGLSVIGVFHSHPDQEPLPSAFDLDRALPWFSYVIVRVDKGVATGSRSWRPQADRSFQSEELKIV